MAVRNIDFRTRIGIEFGGFEVGHYADDRRDGIGLLARKTDTSADGIGVSKYNSREGFVDQHRAGGFGVGDPAAFQQGHPHRTEVSRRPRVVSGSRPLTRWVGWGAYDCYDPLEKRHTDAGSLHTGNGFEAL